MALSCPGCRQAMVAIDDLGVALDLCPSCNGLWFDAGELRQRGASLPPRAPIDRGAGERLCPHCEKALHVLDFELVEIDRCPYCRGLYLDDGEIDLLMRTQRPVPREPAAEAPPMPEFLCDLCHRRARLDEQVIGELLTVCHTCAERHGISHDPKARRQAELDRQREREEADRAVPKDGRSSRWLAGDSYRSSGSFDGAGVFSFLLDLLWFLT